MAEIISNTSPLQYLHQIAQLEILPVLCPTVLVPGPVVSEIEVGRSSGVDLPDLTRLPWITVMSPAAMPVLGLVTDLGLGEAAVLALALERPGAIALLDDRPARKLASVRGIPVVGTLGILIQAKKRGIIPEVKPLVEKLQRLGFRLNARTREAYWSWRKRTRADDAGKDRALRRGGGGDARVHHGCSGPGGLPSRASCSCREDSEPVGA